MALGKAWQALEGVCAKTERQEGAEKGDGSVPMCWRHQARQPGLSPGMMGVLASFNKRSDGSEVSGHSS